MSQALKIGIIGDFHPGSPSQAKTIEALEQVAGQLAIAIEPTWLATPSLGAPSGDVLSVFHGVWAGPGDYQIPSGALTAIRFCREQQRPFFGT